VPFRVQGIGEILYRTMLPEKSPSIPLYERGKKKPRPYSSVSSINNKVHSSG
jgi:hypothetical protein